MYSSEQLATVPPELRDYIRALEARAAVDRKQIGALQQSAWIKGEILEWADACIKASRNNQS